MTYVKIRGLVNHGICMIQKNWVCRFANVEPLTQYSPKHLSIGSRNRHVSLFPWWTLKNEESIFWALVNWVTKMDPSASCLTLLLRARKWDAPSLPHQQFSKRNLQRILSLLPSCSLTNCPLVLPKRNPAHVLQSICSKSLISSLKPVNPNLTASATSAVRHQSWPESASP